MKKVLSFVLSAVLLISALTALPIGAYASDPACPNYDSATHTSATSLKLESKYDSATHTITQSVVCIECGTSEDVMKISFERENDYYCVLSIEGVENSFNVSVEDVCDYSFGAGFYQDGVTEYNVSNRQALIFIKNSSDALGESATNDILNYLDFTNAQLSCEHKNFNSYLYIDCDSEGKATIYNQANDCADCGVKLYIDSISSLTIENVDEVTARLTFEPEEAGIGNGEYSKFEIGMMYTDLVSSGARFSENAVSNVESVLNMTEQQFTCAHSDLEPYKVTYTSENKEIKEYSKCPKCSLVFAVAITIKSVNGDTIVFENNLETGGHEVIRNREAFLSEVGAYLTSEEYTQLEQDINSMDEKSDSGSGSGDSGSGSSDGSSDSAGGNSGTGGNSSSAPSAGNADNNANQQAADTTAQPSAPGSETKAADAVITVSASVPKTAISKLISKNKSVTVKWKTKKVSGYQIQYSTSKKFKTGKATKAVTVKKSKTKSKTIKKLKAGTKYYVRIRTYKTINGKKKYSKWSKAKAVTVK